MKKKLIQERNGCDDHTSGHERNGQTRRLGRERKEKRSRVDKGTSSEVGTVALEEGQSRQISVSDLAEELGLHREDSHNVCSTEEDKNTDTVEVKSKSIGDNSSRILKQWANQPTRADDFVQLRQKAKSLIDTVKQMTDKYLDLCVFIREKLFRPEEVSKELYSLGFRKERISEIKRVCFSTDEIFNDYRNRLIGWKAALERIRKNRDHHEQLELQWNELFRAIERQWTKAPPTRCYYQGPKQCLLMWHREDKEKVIEIEGWKIEVKKDNYDRTTGN